MTGRLDGKVALISGAARGQGAEEARRFVAEGARVILGDVLDDEGGAVAESLGTAARYVHLDVTSEDDWASAVAVTDVTFGGLHVLVNNAGVLGFGQIEKTTLDDFVRVIMINQVGPFLGIKAAVPLLARSGGGSIVNISSTAGLGGVPYAAAYSSSKFALRGLTKSAAMELGRKGIRVNSVHPGGVRTAMTDAVGDSGDSAFYRRLPIPRIGEVDDIANVVLFLASDESAYCTGAEFVVDGGATAGDNNIFDR
jgi:3alpha(or 20beta)-hydroxysteroid dehydrogenase